MRIRAACVCWALLCCAQMSAREIYVNNMAGDDLFAGSLPGGPAGIDGPVRTIAKATRIASPGDRIILAATAQPYRESISLVGLKHSASAAEPLVISGNGAILDGRSPIPASAWQHYAADVFRFRPQRLRFQQLFLDARPALRHPAGEQAEGPPQLEPLEWSLAGGYVYFRVQPSRMPEAYQPACAALQTGITLYHVGGVEIRDLIVQGFQLDGINAFDSATAVRLVRVTARGNGRSGISVGGASRVEIRDSLVGDNGMAQLRTEGFSATHVVDSQLLDNTAPATDVVAGQLWIDGRAIPAGQH